MTRIIVHAGFHKTGTTSLQRFLEINAEALTPYVRVILKPQMEDVAASARDYANTTPPRRLVRASFKKQFSALLARTSTEPNQTVLISCEALVGRIPGRDKVEAFDAAPALAQDMLTTATKNFGPELDITFFYTTRENDTWMQSAYAHLLQRTKFTMSMETFTAKYAKAGDLTSVLSDITKTIAPLVPVVSALEDTSSQKFGPASKLLDLLNLPPEVIETLQPAQATNLGADVFEQRKLMEYNQSDLDGEELSLAKRRFLRKRRNRIKRRLESN